MSVDLYIDSDALVHIDGDIAVMKPWADVRAYGAKGDGITNDTSAIQSAIDAMSSGGIVFFPVGIYLINSTIDLDVEGIRLMGSTARASHIHDSEKASVLRLNADTTLLDITAVACSVENLYFDGNGKTGELINMTTANDTSFQNVTFLDGLSALKATSSVHVSFDNCVWRNCGSSTTTYAIQIVNGETALTSCSDWWFNNCCWEQGTAYQFYFDSSGAGINNSCFYFFAPKVENGCFIRGTVDLLNIFGGYIRNDTGTSVINLTDSDLGKIYGTYLRSTTNVVTITGDYWVISGCECACTTASASANISITGDKNIVTGCTLINYGTLVTLTGSNNQEGFNYPKYYSYTPTLTNITAGDGTLTASYALMGNLCYYSGGFTMGTTSAMGTSPTFSLPISANSNVLYQYGQCYIRDTSVATYTDFVCYASGSTLSFTQKSGTNNNISATVPMTWGNTDTIRFSIIYVI